jgi:hypothetical protein
VSTDYYFAIRRRTVQERPQRKEKKAVDHRVRVEAAQAPADGAASKTLGGRVWREKSEPHVPRQALELSRNEKRI